MIGRLGVGLQLSAPSHESKFRPLFGKETHACDVSITRKMKQLLCANRAIERFAGIVPQVFIRELRAGIVASRMSRPSIRFCRLAGKHTNKARRSIQRPAVVTKAVL